MSRICQAQLFVTWGFLMTSWTNPKSYKSLVIPTIEVVLYLHSVSTVLGKMCYITYYYVINIKSLLLSFEIWKFV